MANKPSLIDKHPGAPAQIWEQLNRFAQAQMGLVLPFDSVDAVVAAAERELGPFFQFSDEQRAAVRQSLTSQVCVIAGGTGTGKATVLRALRSDATANLEYQVLVLDRLTLLDIDKRLPAMLALMADNPTLRLVLIGDGSRLPPVQGANVLTDLLASGELPTVKLTQVFRQPASTPDSRVDTPVFRDLLLDYSSSILRSDMSGHQAREQLVAYLESVVAQTEAGALAGASVDALQDAAAAHQYAMVPYRMNRAMNEVLSDEGWQWEDLLAAAEAVTDEQYEAVAQAGSDALRAGLREVVALIPHLLVMVAALDADRTGLVPKVVAALQRLSIPVPAGLPEGPLAADEPAGRLTLNHLDEFVDHLRQLAHVLLSFDAAAHLVTAAVRCLRRHDQPWKDLVPVAIGDHRAYAADGEGARIQDLVALVRQLSYALGKSAPGHALAARATNYLARKGLEGSPLRAEGPGCAGIELNPAKEPVTRVRLAADVVAAQSFLDWNRSESKPPVAIPKEYFVAAKAIALYCAALTEEHNAQVLPAGFLAAREAAWQDSSRLLAVGLGAPRSPKFDEWFERGFRAALARR